MILNIETALTYCSTSITEQSEIIDQLTSSTINNHAYELGVIIEKILKNNNIKVADLQAIAVSSGPGSYTGLRIGVSTAKGLAYAAKKPLISVNTLEILTQALFSHYPEIANNNTILCPMIDARRMEVFTCFFNSSGEQISEPGNLIIDQFSFLTPLENTRIIFYGNGSQKFKNTITHQNAVFIDNIEPNAQFMAKISEDKLQKKQFVDLAYFEPLYIKPFIATTPKNKLW